MMTEDLDKLVGIDKEKKKSNKKGPVKKDDMVTVEYEGKFEDGTVFDSSKKAGRPLEFQVGAGMVIKGFDGALIGMKPSEEKDLTIKPEEGYGMPNPEMVKDVPKPSLPPEQKLEKGMMLMLGMPNGQKFPAKVMDIGEDTIKLDLNHPLAGKTLKFHIKLVAII